MVSYHVHYNRCFMDLSDPNGYYHARCGVLIINKKISMGHARVLSKIKIGFERKNARKPTTSGRQIMM